MKSSMIETMDTSTVPVHNEKYKIFKSLATIS